VGRSKTSSAVKRNEKTSRKASRNGKKSTAIGTIDVHDQCRRCRPAKCCQYFSLEIDRPRSKKDYDDLLWFLAHENVSIYLWKRAWYLMVHNPCVFLDRRTNLCTIYDRRPRICREHSTEDCEFDSDYEFDEHFKSYDDLLRWLRKKGIFKKK
jgi:hypothetical protein